MKTSSDVFVFGNTGLCSYMWVLQFIRIVVCINQTVGVLHYTGHPGLDRLNERY